MLPTLLLLTVALADAPPVDVDTLKGESFRGTLVKLTADSLTLSTDGKESVLPAEDLLEIRWPLVPSTTTQPPVLVTLADGSRLSCTSYSTSRAVAKLEGPYGTLEVPVGQVAHVRFSPGTEAQTTTWAQYVEKAKRDDMLVTLEKDGSLDRISGVVSDVGAEVSFLLDGEELKVDRQKLHGIIYRKRDPARRSGAPLTLSLMDSDILYASAAAWDGEKLKVTLPAGGSVSIPADRLRSLDFSSGKVKFLSAEAPREVSAVSIWGDVKVPEGDLGKYFRRDRTSFHEKFALKKKEYRRGLFLYPDTTVRYRIGGDYTRFKALVGIDDGESTNDYGNARLKIQGDSRVLFEGDVKFDDPVRSLDLDVTGVRDLIISVTHGQELDHGDYVDLIDARVVK